MMIVILVFNGIYNINDEYWHYNFYNLYNIDKIISYYMYVCMYVKFIIYIFIKYNYCYFIHYF